MRKFYKSLLFVLPFSFCRVAYGSCAFQPGQQMRTLQFTLPSSLSIPRDTPNGTIVYQDERAISDSLNAYECDTPFSRGSVDERGYHNQYGIYPIGNTGIAWQWRSSAPWNEWIQWPNNIMSKAGIYKWDGTTQGFNLVKIGPLNEGESISPGLLGYLNADRLHTLGISVTRMGINAQTCRTPDFIQVSLGGISVSSLFLDEYPKIRWFSINLHDCPSGISKIHYRLVPLASSPIVNSSGISLNANSTARGVGVKLWNAAALGFDLNNIYAAGDYTPGTSSYAIIIGAQYFRLPGYTIGDVKPGTANAEINFYIEYL